MLWARSAQFRAKKRKPAAFLSRPFKRIRVLKLLDGILLLCTSPTRRTGFAEATKVAGDIIHAAGVRGLSLHHLGKDPTPAARSGP